MHQMYSPSVVPRYAARVRRADSTIQSVGIVGAGLAGLCTAKVLRELGFTVTVFEKGPDVGGVWASARRYPGLTTQNPRDTYAFSDHPMPRDFPEWPSGKQVQSYLESYVARFDLRQHLHLNHEVVSAAPTHGGWEMVTRVAGAERKANFDAIVVCNGIFSDPAVPAFVGADIFQAAGGQVAHTSEFTDALRARGRDVLVIGYGKSSCDLACALAPIARSVTVIARSLTWKIPKQIGNVVNFKHLFLTRMGEGLFRYIRVQGFERFLHGAGLPVRNAMLGTVERVVARQLGLRRAGLHPDKPLETIARSTVSLVSDGFYESIHHGGLAMRAHATISQLRPGQAVLSTGEVLSADIIVCGTGWNQGVPFLDEATRAKVTDAVGNFRLYRSLLPVGVPGLAFNGYNSSFFSQLNAEIGAMWLADFWLGGVRTPPAAEQNAEINARLAWMEARTDGKHSKGTNIIPFSVHHLDELLDDMDLQLSGAKRLRQWFTPIDPGDYAPLIGRLRSRYPDAAAASERTREFA